MHALAGKGANAPMSKGSKWLLSFLHAHQETVFHPRNRPSFPQSHLQKQKRKRKQNKEMTWKGGGRQQNTASMLSNDFTDNRETIGAILGPKWYKHAPSIETCASDHLAGRTKEELSAY